MIKQIHDRFDSVRPAFGLGQTTIDRQGTTPHPDNADHHSSHQPSAISEILLPAAAPLPEMAPQLEEFAQLQTKPDKDDQPTETAPSALHNSASATSWDFQTTFPKPTQAAIRAGFIGYCDIGENEIRAIQEEYANECLATLEFLDELETAKVTGIDPRDGSRPDTEKACQRPKIYLEWATAATAHTFEGMTFGPAATQAFRTWITKQHQAEGFRAFHSRFR